MRKVPHGTYTSEFRRFYKSGRRRTRKEYESLDEAINAQKSMLRLMSEKRIYDTRITRRLNILYLEKREGTDFKQRIMEKFLKVD